MGIEDAKNNIKLHRAHRIGRYNNNKTRPIVAKFVYYPDRERVRLNGNKLFKPQGVSQQYPPEMMATRKRLIPIMLDARRNGKEISAVIGYLLTDNYTEGLKPEPEVNRM